jgi:hypothetical protein
MSNKKQLYPKYKNSLRRVEWESIASVHPSPVYNQGPEPRRLDTHSFVTPWLWKSNCIGLFQFSWQNTHAGCLKQQKYIFSVTEAEDLIRFPGGFVSPNVCPHGWQADAVSSMFSVLFAVWGSPGIFSGVEIFSSKIEETDHINIQSLDPLLTYQIFRDLTSDSVILWDIGGWSFNRGSLGQNTLQIHQKGIASYSQLSPRLNLELAKNPYNHMGFFLTKSFQVGGITFNLDLLRWEDSLLNWATSSGGIHGRKKLLLSACPWSYWQLHSFIF